MKCPLRLIGFQGDLGLAEFPQVDCLKEGCAWWDDATKVCVISRIGLSLNVLVAVLSVIKDEMPRKKEVT